MTYLVTPGSRADLELTIVDVDGNLVDVFTVTFQVLDAADASVATGAAQWESLGTYVAYWTVPSNATIGDRYLVKFTVTVDANGATEVVQYIVQIQGATL